MTTATGSPTLLDRINSLLEIRDLRCAPASIIRGVLLDAKDRIRELEENSSGASGDRKGPQPSEQQLTTSLEGTAP